MRRQFGAVAVLSTAVAVLSLAGCGGSSSTNPNGGSDNFKSLPQAEQASFEQAAVAEVTADISSFTTFSPYAGLFAFDKSAPNRFTGALRAMRIQRNVPRFQNTNCETVSGDFSDPDNDGVPNADTVTFNCNETSNGETITESGNFAYGDPTPNTQDLDVSDAGNLSLGLNGSTDGNITLALQGSSSISEGSNELTLTGNWNLNEQVANNPNNYNGTFKLAAQETATYSFSGTAPTTFGTLPEPGQFSVSGSWSYAITATNENINLAFTVSTPTALTIDGCTGNSSGIESGEVDIKFADGTLVKAQWANCQSSPSITVT